jgi:hypothetical protein
MATSRATGRWTSDHLVARDGHLVVFERSPSVRMRTVSVPLSTRRKTERLWIQLQSGFGFPLGA